MECDDSERGREGGTHTLVPLPAPIPPPGQIRTRLLDCDDLTLELLTALDELEQCARALELRNDAFHRALRLGKLRHSRVHLRRVGIDHTMWISM